MVLDDELQGRWELLQDGVVIANGLLDGQHLVGNNLMDIDPHEKRDFDLQLPPSLAPELPLQPGDDFFINLIFETKRDAFYAAAGHVVALEQFSLRPDDSPPVLTPEATGSATAALRVNTGAVDGLTTITGEDFVLEFSGSLGTLTSFMFDGVEMLEGLFNRFCSSTQPLPLYDNIKAFSNSHLLASR